MKSYYVDDNRQATSKLKKGSRIVKEEMKFVFKEEWLEEDLKTKETNTQRMVRVCLEAMESINPDLKFTTEIAEDLLNLRLATLDFEL